jgi:phosphate starvation-inducible protein PhoH and related proteins
MTTHDLYDLALHDRELRPVIAHGVAGTGKTYNAVGAAIEWLSDKRKKCVVTRPNVPFAKELGFLPGTQREKMDPWVKPVEQCFKQQGFNEGHLSMLEKQGRLVYLPLETAQGLTFDDSFIIVDECQHLEFSQLKILLTRTGKYSKLVLCGDIAQTSPHFKRSGLAKLIDMVDKLNLNCHVVTFGPDDILRSTQCKEWILAFDSYEAMQENK